MFVIATRPGVPLPEFPSATTTWDASLLALPLVRPVSGQGRVIRQQLKQKRSAPLPALTVHDAIGDLVSIPTGREGVSKPYRCGPFNYFQSQSRSEGNTKGSSHEHHTSRLTQIGALRIAHVPRSCNAGEFQTLKSERRWREIRELPTGDWRDMPAISVTVTTQNETNSEMNEDQVPLIPGNCDTCTSPYTITVTQFVIPGGRRLASVLCQHQQRLVARCGSCTPLVIYCFYQAKLLGQTPVEWVLSDNNNRPKPFESDGPGAASER